MYSSIFFSQRIVYWSHHYAILSYTLYGEIYYRSGSKLLGNERFKALTLNFLKKKSWKILDINSCHVDYTAFELTTIKN